MMQSKNMSIYALIDLLDKYIESEKNQSKVGLAEALKKAL